MIATELLRNSRETNKKCICCLLIYVDDVLDGWFASYVCVSSVFLLTARCSSLTVNLIVTLRKFISLLLSVIYFDNNFTTFHWFGTFLVFTGTLLFTDILSSSYSHQHADVVVGSERVDRYDYLSVNGQQPTSTSTFTDSVVTKRTIDHNVAGKDYLEVNKCSYHDS